MVRKSLTPQIVGNVIEFIQTNGIGKGEHLPLQMLADAFRVSRAPIMSALKQLETQGVVRAEPNRGYFLAVDPGGLQDMKSAGVEDGEGDEAIYFRIAEDRLAGKLDERMSENELMRFYDLPRTKLLRVLRRIAEEGWIERLPGNGWAFTQALTSKKSYEDGYAFRAVIEQQAMLLPSFEPNPEGLKRAREVQTRLRDGGYETWSRAEIFKANNEFHEMLVACSQNEFFLDAIRRINRLRRLLEYHITIDRSRLPRQTEEHLQILDLIEHGRRNEAAAFLYTHIMGASRIKSPKV
ncbi:MULTISPECIES: GntR family transcriptional regulator [Rhizobium/Agrobacterium group]|uniref:Nta operon transcriptional regulator n=1 Tax=Agrobacterium tomkonis CFBP 6623 TaxID=1183432 RepID=A0A1S7RG15_9HYPH|nr:MULTISPECIES: GntR family transcriptional regulator [Rhizobium/Agrobacterium group]KRA56436.1 transcriptional regulator [Rhizobium sp. Root651]QCL91529.1 GntR family transcriptional regulator [Agrobacterium tumefaciens]TKT56911.1 GntR family transcriptional regulator [Agrobacterium sp. LC34]CUX51974.1 Nta operon transcriptional regulator [Agrobacterium tomkonis CFBP 6623]